MTLAIKHAGNFLSVIPDTVGMWSIADYYPKGVRLKSIVFKPSASNDILVVREKSINGPIIFWVKDISATGSIIYLNGSLCNPVINFNECYFSNSNEAEIAFHIY